VVYRNPLREAKPAVREKVELLAGKYFFVCFGTTMFCSAAEHIAKGNSFMP
jgi:hypothetical protein